jgi:pimeloyl-ACP methyl ester carboxylesterase
VSRTRYARNGTVRIAYELRGRLAWWRPWLVLIQGVGFDRSGWRPVLRKLRRRFRLVLADNRGSGRSDPPGGLLTVGAMAGDIVAVLDDAGVTRAHVLGVSLGGMVAQDLAFYHPERVDGLVLVSTTPGWPFGYPMPASSARLLAATGGMTREDALSRHTENALSTVTVQRHPELVGRLVDFQRSRLPADPRGWSAQVAAGAYYAGRLRPASIRARTLVLHGDADTVVDPRNGKLLASRIPGARLVAFPGLGHLLFWEDPKGFARAVTTFLRSPGWPGPQAPPPPATRW